MRYVLSFGSANAGGVPVFGHFKNADTLVALAAPTIVEDEDGDYYFDYDWALVSATSFKYQVSLNGLELTGVESNPTVTAGAGAGSVGAAIPTWAETAGALINDVAVEVGLTEVSDPYASVDPNFKRMRKLLVRCGQELVMARQWKTLTKEASFTGDGVSTLFTLPADWSRMVDGSGWRRSDAQPFAGPLTSQEWQYAQARNTTAAVSVFHRIVGNMLQLFSIEAVGAVLFCDYVSRYWVASVGATSPDLFEPSMSADRIVLEPAMVGALLKVKWLDATGRDSASAREEYRTAYHGAASLDPSPTLNITKSRFRQELIGVGNLPSTFGP